MRTLCPTIIQSAFLIALLGSVHSPCHGVQPPGRWIEKLDSGKSAIGQLPTYYEVGVVTCFAASPIRPTVALGTKTEVVFWDTHAKQTVSRTSIEGSVTSLDYSVDGQFLACVSQTLSNQGFPSGSATLSIFETGKGSVLWRVKIPKTDRSYVHNTVFSPARKQIAVCIEGQVLIYSLENQQRLVQLHQPNSYSIAFTGNGELLALNHQTNTIDRWNLEVGELIGPFLDSGLKKDSYGITLSPNQTFLSACGRDGFVIFRFDGKERIRIPPELDGLKGVFDITFSNDESTIAISTRTGSSASTRIVRTSDWKTVKRIQRPGFPTGQAFDAQGVAIHLASNDQIGISTVPILQDAKPELAGLQARSSTFAFTSGGKSILASSNTGRLAQFDVETGKPIFNISAIRSFGIDVSNDDEIAILRGHSSIVAITSLKKPYNTQRLKFGSNYEPTFFDRVDEALGTSPEKHSGYRFGYSVNTFQFADNTKDIVASGSIDNQARLIRWNPFTGKTIQKKNFQLRRLLGEKWSSSSVASVSHDAKTIAVATGWYLSLIDTKEYEVVDSIQLPDNIEDLKWSPDSQLLLAKLQGGNKPEQLVVLDANTLTTVFQHEGERLIARLSNDGLRLLISSGNGVSVVETSSWETIYTDPQKRRAPIAISHDGRWVALGRDDCRIEIWDVGVLVRSGNSKD